VSLGTLLLKLLFPPRCPFCREVLRGTPPEGEDYPGWVKEEMAPEIICGRCAAFLPWIVMGCPRCAGELLGKVGCSCSKYDYAFDNCCAVGRYTGEVRKTLHSFKYHQKQWLSEPLGRLLSWKLSSLCWAASIEAIVPIPLSPRRLGTRGYNQAALLARVVGRELGVPVLDILQRVKETESQTGLKREKRWENLKGAFRCREGGKSYGHLLLLDDILTTGATAHEAALALKDGVDARVSVAVFAR
jgi:ComF family protein